ncbi:hypothetical protein BU25DRAFT_426460 [Macroventuria anomochaeta]|uniref:Uncharacterized protein n=1 Tax=Macroventuria anomochaeta TaxID=301207 RepID=A0ACB6RHJ6_9PLEO|nr:uncharacterized protein BU25DRAFT_426460 [Macroventuria anomochaeta]KAF2621425.1 hypothetical protein BU25DRAFT_426460 [Macroventuria anomochaeta]
MGEILFDVPLRHTNRSLYAVYLYSVDEDLIVAGSTSPSQENVLLLSLSTFTISLCDAIGALAVKVRPGERSETVEWNEIDPVVEINVTGAWHPQRFLWLTGTCICILARLAQMGLISGDKEQWTRRDSLNVFERIDVQEFDIAGYSWSKAICTASPPDRGLSSYSACDVCGTVPPLAMWSQWLRQPPQR